MTPKSQFATHTRNIPELRYRNFMHARAPIAAHYHKGRTRGRLTLGLDEFPFLVAIRQIAYHS